MMINKITAAYSLIGRHSQIQEKWEYIDEPTYSRSIGSHVCMTCSEFDYTSKPSCGSILFCNWHQKLIFHAQHLTHSCEFYKKTKFGFNKKLNLTSKFASKT